MDTLSTTTNNSYLITKNFACESSDTNNTSGGHVSFPAPGIINNNNNAVMNNVEPMDISTNNATAAVTSSSILFRNEILHTPVPTNVPANAQNIIAQSSNEDVELFYLARYSNLLILCIYIHNLCTV